MNGSPDAEEAKDAGVTISKHTVDRLMRDEGMNGLIRGRRTRTAIPGKDGQHARDQLNRDFFAPHPNQQSYYARTIGPSTDDAADKTAA